MARRITHGKFYPLGATLTPEGVNFALYSQAATGVELLLFDSPDGEPTDIIELRDRQRWIWHVFVEGIKAGQLYGYRVHGPCDPARGLRFNPAKLLMDPYAKALTGKFRNQGNCLLGYDPGAPEKDLSQDTRDNARQVPKSIVVDDAFDWRGARTPDIPLEKLVIYEVHLKGFTAHPSSNATRPGTYHGFIEKIPHLVSLGINAVELLPIHEFYIEDLLTDRGLTNYWGYNTIGFFAPESSYAAGTEPGCQVAEFKSLVRELHRAGIEVILDVVYNHTGEGSELGPTICLRGIDNPTYYSLSGPPEEPGRYYQNPTGCGNAINVASPATIRLIMDSLRYWAQVMHVDGFRFDLASVLGRDRGEYRKTGTFFDAVSQDPVLSRVKLIAEPWDLGTYEVGNFPVDWSEWNGRFRDSARRFIKGDAGTLPELGARITGSADLYRLDGRSPSNSINFVTCHDGFTLNDLVSYNDKHNHANGEDNRDGTNDNRSWNCGVEGETDEREVAELRRRLAKNHVCLVLFSCGTPMLLGGDEFLRTQKGNNNAYCQDNELTWFDWELARKNADFTEFVRKAIALTRTYPVLQMRQFMVGKGESAGAGEPEIVWYGPDLDSPHWGDPEARLLCYQLATPLFFIWNTGHLPAQVRLPELRAHRRWRRIVDTGLPAGEDFAESGREVELKEQGRYQTGPRTTVILVGR